MATFTGCTAVVTNSTGGSATPQVQAVLKLVEAQDVIGQITLQWSGGQPTAEYDIYIDDTPSFSQPILHQSLSANSIALEPTSTGLATGVTYYAKVVTGDGQTTAQTTFRLTVNTWSEPAITYDYARAAWQNSGRSWMTASCGVAWDATSGGWKVLEPWADEYTNVAQDAYASEFAALGAVNLAAVHHDLKLLDEMARFYVVYESRFTTLGAMKAMTQYDTSLLSGPDTTKTLIWVWNDGTTTYVRECDLCNSQFYYPVAKLLRVVTTLDPSEITPPMQSFVQWYAPVLTHDHLLRLFYRNNAQELNRIQHLPGGFTDGDLWLAAEAAELLGALANVPQLEVLSDAEVTQLRQAVQLTVKTLQANYRTTYPGTRNWQAQEVGSASYFNGEYSLNDLSSYTYSGYVGQTFPTPSDAAYQIGASWDVSHFHRVPIFFRALFDNRKATGSDFPAKRDLEWLTNQMVYKTFQGNYDLPLFNNFFEGSNGWYRVGYDGSGFGYPPAQDCDSHQQVDNHVLACLTAGSVQGWGLLAFVNADLAELEHSLAKLAVSQDATQVTFRTRYFYYANQDYSVLDAQSQTKYPILLFFVMATAAERLQ